MKRCTVALALLLGLITIIHAEGGSARARGACSRNGEICVIDLETGEERTITSGHEDMKPSWSMEGDQIVFFRVTKKRERVQDWKTAICVINADGSGFRQITDGTYADYNPTWTKDGTHRVLYSRYFNIRAKSVIHRVKIDGDEIKDEIVSDVNESEYALTSLRDGRILITSDRAIFTSIHWILTPGSEGLPGSYQKVNFGFKMKGIMDRCSVSPDETKLTYEYKKGYKSFNYLNKVITIADFDKETGTVSNPRPISKRAPEAMTLYPRWLLDGTSVIYHSNRAGKPALYKYNLADESTVRIEGKQNVPYEFFCGEGWPK